MATNRRNKRNTADNSVRVHTVVEDTGARAVVANDLGLPIKRSLADANGASVSNEDAANLTDPKRARVDPGNNIDGNVSLPMADIPNTSAVVGNPLTGTAAQETVRVTADPIVTAQDRTDCRNGSDSTLSGNAPRSSTPSNWASSQTEHDPIIYHPLFTGADHVPFDVLQRSLDFVRMSDAVNYRYALGQIPANAKWGTRYESEKYLCVNNQRLTVWVVGVVKSTWFTGEGGAPAARVSVGLHLPFEGDIDALHDLYKRGRPTPTKFTERAFASCFQSRRPKGSSESVTLPFDRIYDATEKFRSKNKMSKIPHGNFGRGDYVLLEAWINRYKTAGDKKVSGDWTDWLVSLELREVSVLFATPDGYIDEEDAPPPEIEDDL